MDTASQIRQMAKRAKAASRKMGLVPTGLKNKILNRMAQALLLKSSYLMKENQKDLESARRQGYAKALIDRLVLKKKHIDEMSACLAEIARLKDPVGEVIKSFKRPNGLVIKKVRIPIGVIGVIYESRPNVTSDCIGLCLKSGNAVILKGGREAFFSNRAIFAVLRDTFKKTPVPWDAVNFVDTLDRQAVDVLLGLDQYIDLIIPRGGEELIKVIAEKSSIPVIKNFKGVCHTYVSRKADLDMARQICFNAKVQKPSVCNAMETLLVQRDSAKKFLPVMIRDYQAAGVEIRGCPHTRRIVKDGVKAAAEKDWEAEYLDLILAVKVVKNLQEAIDHINTYGSHHSDSIITSSKQEADRFLKEVDSACVYVNASTRFTDGHQFGLGAEIGISTDKLHARGPMALEELTSYKYLVYGKGQVRQ